MTTDDRADENIVHWLEHIGLPFDLSWLDSLTTMSRRSALKLLGASLALAAGIPGCQRKPQRKIVSIPTGPEYQKPGVPLYYASTWTEGPIPYGMVVKTVDGRPIKIEGNPAHPVNRGTSSAAMQASILSLYDPDRLRTPLRNGRAISWKQADQEIVSALRQAESVVIMTRANLGPAERALMAMFLKSVPHSRHFVYEAVHDGLRRSAWKTIFGQDIDLQPRFDLAKIILSIESDFLAVDGPVLQSTREFAQARQPDIASNSTSMPRLYVAEGPLSLTGANADHRLRLRPSTSPVFVQALRRAIGGDNDALNAFARTHHLDLPVVRALVDDLVSHRGQALVVAGAHLPQAVHAAVCLLNDELGAIGKTLEPDLSPAALAANDPEEIEATLNKGANVLICLGVNPVYSWPTGNFADRIGKVGLSIGHGLLADETVSACTLSLPSSHNLESWNDATSGQGVYSLCQPVIAPLYASRQEAESLFVWLKQLAENDAELSACKDWHDFVRRQWLERIYPDANDQEKQWEESLQSCVAELPVKKALPPLNRSAAEVLSQTQLSGVVDGYELSLQPHATLYDGRFANNAWLQELPDPLTMIVWDNVAAISPATARRLNVDEGEIVEVTSASSAVELPVLIQPGMADDLLATTLGYGRTRAGAAGSNVGVNVLRLMQPGTASVGLSTTVRIKSTGKKHTLVRTQKHDSMENRPIVIDATLAEYERDPNFVKRKQPPSKEVNIYKPYDYSKGYKWVMVIDLSRCTGCGSCVIACQAENNSPVVGKDECDRGRQMHWIRIDRYFRFPGSKDDPTVLKQPMLCQQCGNAPCENVCPVNATAHDSEGLNQMVYNRCIGTRYCSNNCPYKVRRFNFFDYQKRRLKDSVQELVYNPQVTVRSRGVMEKCTFCIQRINTAKFQAKNKGKDLPDGAVQTACQQACPAGAIMFGNINDLKSQVAAWNNSPRAYHVLQELNTQPSVAYLAKLSNPHPDISATASGGHG